MRGPRILAGGLALAVVAVPGRAAALQPGTSPAPATPPMTSPAAPPASPPPPEASPAAAPGTPPVASPAVAPATDADARAPVIEILVDASPATMSKIEGAVAPGAGPVRWVPAVGVDESDVLRPPRTGDPVEARVWIDATRPNAVLLYFANRRADRFLVRQLPAPEGLDAGALEALAQVVETSIVALRTEAGVGMNREQIRSALRSRSPPPSTRPSGWRPRLVAFYAVDAFSREALVSHGPGVEGALDRRHGATFAGGWLSVEYRFAQVVETPLAGVRLEGGALRLGLEAGRAASPSLDVLLRLGPGGDLVQVTPRLGSAAAPLALAGSRWTWAWTARAELVAIARVARQVPLTAAAFVDFDLAARHYDVDAGGGRVRVFTPWAVHPGASVGIGWP